MDVGAAAGSPGFRSRSSRAAAAATLIESVGKKARFLEGRGRARTGATVVEARAEEAGRDPELRERFRSATARAVGTLPTVLELTLPCSPSAGRPCCSAARSTSASAVAAADAAPMLGGEVVAEHVLDGERARSSSCARSRRPPRASRAAPACPQKRPLCLGPRARDARVTQADAAAIDADLGRRAAARRRLYAVGGRVRDEVRAAVEGIAVPLVDLDYVVAGVPWTRWSPRCAASARPTWSARPSRSSSARCAARPSTSRSRVANARPAPGHRDFDVHAGAGVPLVDDLARRDFRMNMLARAFPEGEIVDPYGGEADIRAGRIDMLRPEAFVEDPLRMLRACQFAARFEYEISPATMDAMRGAAPLAASVSPERVRDELVKLLGAKRPSIGFEAMRAGGLLPVILPSMARTVGVEQNEWHAYDVYQHTLATVDAAPAGDLVLRLAALFHDIAKPQTKDGPHFYRHEIVGEEDARETLTRLRFSGDGGRDGQPPGAGPHVRRRSRRQGR